MTRAVHESIQSVLDRLPEELLEAWEERAAIREYDGGYSRPHAEALALLDLIDDEPDVLSDMRAFQIDAKGQHRYFVGQPHLLEEHAEIIGGTVAARRSVAWCIDEEFGGLAELVVAA
jgi:hypothetical protein